MVPSNMGDDALVIMLNVSKPGKETRDQSVAIARALALFDSQPPLAKY
jgi:hypothetical protein